MTILVLYAAQMAHFSIIFSVCAKRMFICALTHLNCIPHQILLEVTVEKHISTIIVCMTMFSCKQILEEIGSEKVPCQHACPTCCSNCSLTILSHESSFCSSRNISEWSLCSVSRSCCCLRTFSRTCKC